MWVIGKEYRRAEGRIEERLLHVLNEVTIQVPEFTIELTLSLVPDNEISLGQSRDLISIFAALIV